MNYDNYWGGFKKFLQWNADFSDSKGNKDWLKISTQVLREIRNKITNSV